MDLHYGDNTATIRGDPDVKIVNPWPVDENIEYLDMARAATVSRLAGLVLGIFSYPINLTWMRERLLTGVPGRAAVGTRMSDS